MRNCNKVRAQATFKHCGKVYLDLSTGGTGHLIRHIPKCSVLLARTRKSAQSQLGFSSDGNMHLWQYNEEVART
jgi:phage FluMu protein Com